MMWRVIRAPSRSCRSPGRTAGAGLSEAATALCLRGLEAYPTHVEGARLLALLYLDGGDHQRAADEWSMVLRSIPTISMRCAAWASATSSRIG
jgi:cytochrome c-type biogenesis protein CcmH/NrfG